MTVEPLALLPLTKMARELGVPQDWLRQEAESGNLPSVLAGTAILFHPPTVERVLIERASQSAEVDA